MSALTPHIRAIRAEVEHLHAVADETADLTVAKVLRALAAAKEGAATQLEVDEQAQLDRLTGPA